MPTKVKEKDPRHRIKHRVVRVVWYAAENKWYAKLFCGHVQALPHPQETAAEKLSRNRRCRECERLRDARICAKYGIKTTQT